MDATTDRPTLNEIERHIARLYSTGLALASESVSTHPQASQELLAQILGETETINHILHRIDPLDFDLDVSLDIAVILSRALNVWSLSVKRWQSQPSQAALVTAARELTDAGLVLHDALASSVRLSASEEPFMPPARQVQ
jgi:hypothetical protein